eukprot:3032432-Pyramimonas_sp.AAC.1
MEREACTLSIVSHGGAAGGGSRLRKRSGLRASGDSPRTRAAAGASGTTEPSRVQPLGPHSVTCPARAIARTSAASAVKLCTLLPARGPTTLTSLRLYYNMFYRSSTVDCIDL